MPYVLMSTQIRLENGPTVVGDEWSDPDLMEYLDASLGRTLGNNFLEWVTQHCPRVVLDKLEKKGYRVVCMTGINQTCVWTLFKPDDSQKNDINNRMTLRAPPTRADATEIMDTCPEKL
ncbi:GTP cyclohydrolase 1 feedback regulatory protein-like [Liolophura sinensis]|uniref:GTP cyclohydrolase 1 feedback regulatory protein-like n=1 Tax=Liolophura sinensis TaxID=3198878 RepID=UPI003158B95A